MNAIDANVFKKQDVIPSNVSFIKKIEETSDVFAVFNQMEKNKSDILFKDFLAITNNNETPIENNNKKNKYKKLLLNCCNIVIVILLFHLIRRSFRRSSEINNAFVGIRNIIDDIPPSSPPPSSPPPPPPPPPPPSSPPQFSSFPKVKPPIIVSDNPLFKLAMALKLTKHGIAVPEVVLPKEEFEKLLEFLKHHSFNELSKDVQNSLLFYINKLPMKLKKMLPQYVFNLLPKS